MRRMITAAALSVLMMVPVLAQSGDQAYAVGNGVKPPVLVKEVHPKYTDGAMRRKVQGVVELSVVVNKDGKAGDMSVTRSLDEELDVQAMNAVRQWEFQPGTKDGQPVNVRVSIELTFTLKK